VSKKDITALVERQENFEQRAKVRIDAISAFLSDADDDGEQSVHVRGEVHAIDGTSISNDTELELSIFDGGGRVVETSSDYISAEAFFTFLTFDISAYVPEGLVRRIRILPKVDSSL